MMTRSFVFTNHKGGVGKSTSATNVAYGICGILDSARENGKTHNARVLLIDTDSQGHATLVTTGRNDYGEHDSLYSVIKTADPIEASEVMARCIVRSDWHPDLHVLPATPLLEGAEREMQSVPGAPYRIAKPLQRLAAHYAAIIIDTRPSFSLLTEMGLVAATDAIIPIEPRYLETVGIMSVVQKIYQIRDGWNVPDLQISGVLVTKMDKRIRGHRQLLDDLKAHPILGKLVCGVIPQNEAVSYAHHNHLNLYNYDPKAPASKAYARLAGSLARQIVMEGATS